MQNLQTITMVTRLVAMYQAFSPPLEGPGIGTEQAWITLKLNFYKGQAKDHTFQRKKKKKIESTMNLLL